MLYNDPIEGNTTDKQ